jgi:hypothetical protein
MMPGVSSRKQCHTRPRASSARLGVGNKTSCRRLSHEEEECRSTGRVTDDDLGEGGQKVMEPGVGRGAVDVGDGARSEKLVAGQ